MSLQSLENTRDEVILHEDFIMNNPINNANELITHLEGVINDLETDVKVLNKKIQAAYLDHQVTRKWKLISIRDDKLRLIHQYKGVIADFSKEMI